MITGGGATGADAVVLLWVAHGSGASAAGAFAGSLAATMVASCHCGGEDDVAVVMALVATGEDGVAGGVADDPELNILLKKPVTALSTPENGLEDWLAGALAAGAAFGSTTGASAGAGTVGMLAAEEVWVNAGDTDT
jgi:hypothetical protein